MTDANGNYSFTGLMGGTYKLSEVMQSGWHQTAHPGAVKVRSGTTFTKGNFGNKQNNTHYEDENDRNHDD